MTIDIVKQEWDIVKKELFEGLAKLSDDKTEHKDIYLLMSELLNGSKTKPSGGIQNGTKKNVSQRVKQKES